ncbi:MAG: hypothetical protein ACLP50_20615 [Solirubrobacteraceae bacterium]
MATSTDSAAASFRVPGPLPRDEYERIFSRVPRLDVAALRSHCSWFRVLPAKIHDEQRTFLTAHLEFVTA